jgi:hypothetical protein
MLDSKFLFTLVGLIVAVVAIYKTDMSNKTNEGFIDVPRLNHASRSASNGMSSSSIRGKNQSMVGDNAISSLSYRQGLYSSSQKQNSPFESSSTYKDDRLFSRKGAVINRANITYNTNNRPQNYIQTNQLGFADMAKNDYGIVNKEIILDKPLYDSSYSDATLGMVAVGDMTNIGADGQEKDIVVISDRYMISNARSYTRGQGCSLRGDIAIEPCKEGNWFRTSAGPSDLRAGALNVMGGNFNENSLAVAALQYPHSGGTLPAVAGNPMTHELSNMFDIGMDEALSNVIIGSFP